MSNMIRNDWSLGWFPSQDRSKGDRRGLLRMDNLTLDEHNVLSLTNGITKINQTSFGGAVHSCYSKLIENTKWRYVGLTTGEVLRGSGNDWSNETEVIGAGEGGAEAGNRTIFGSSLGAVFVLAGDARKREIPDFVTGELTSYDITPETPVEAPTILSVNQNVNNFIPFLASESGQWGHMPGQGDNVSATDEETSFDATQSTNIWLYNANVFYWVPGGHLDTRVPGNSQYDGEDGFEFKISIPDTSLLKKVRIEFTKAPGDTAENYYVTEWGNYDNSPFAQGMDVFSTLTCKRSDFIRQGGDPNFGWDSIDMIKVYVETTGASVGFIIREFAVMGGVEGPITGLYDYMQVNCSDNGAYVAKSLKSDELKSVYVYHGFVTIQPTVPTDTQVNKIRIYRRSSDYLTADFVPPGSKPRLAYWYKVAEIDKVPGGSFPVEIEDRMSDEDAIILNQTYNNNLVSLKDYPDHIMGMISEYNGRAIYMTWKEILFSDILDPGLVDATITVRLSGDKFQKNMWMKRTHPNQFYVATTNEIFYLQGTLSYLADGTADIQIVPLGLDVIPISSDVDEDKGILYFLDPDGWKALSGASVSYISTRTELLYQGKDRYGIAALNILPKDQTHYPVTVGKGKLWAGMPGKDGVRYVHVYDFEKAYWYPYYTNPICLFTEEDGTIIAGYGGEEENFLRIFDDSTTSLIDGLNGQSIYFETIADDDGKPDNRKDYFTLKITADTGNMPVTIAIAKAGSEQYYVIGSTAFDGKTDKYITIAESIGPAKSIAVKIYSSNVLTLKLYSVSIEYEDRPIQRTYIRLPAQNLGTVSRKRFVNYAFVIDTLGVTCEFIPLIDNVVAGASSTFSLNGKQTYIHYFYPTSLTDSMQSEFVGTDIGGIICGFFEFYEVNLNEIVSEKLPVPVKSMLIPGNDYGNPNRKRHSSYKFQINTRGSRVQFTPRIDGVWYTPTIHTTSEKQTVEHFFTDDTIGIDIGGRLDSLDDTAFEWYGTIIPQDIEVLPPRLRYYRIPENNFGVASNKRIRTIPIIINTNGQDVTFTPIVDNVRGTPTTLNTPNKQTTFHYFNTDSFGVDYSGDLEATTTTPFESYGFGNLESVEVLPVGKQFDQVGPLRFDRLAKFIRLRLRAIVPGSSLAFKVITETDVTLPNMTGATGEYTGTFITTANTDDVWEVVLPKTIMGTVFRVELGPTTSPFFKYDLEVLCNISGGQTSQKWMKVK